MKPYYEDESVTLYHGDALEVLAGMGERSVDAVITDPPFDARTHSMARSNRVDMRGQRALSGSSSVRFEFVGHEGQLAMFAEFGRLTRRWVVSNISTDTAFRFQVEQPPTGLRLIRVGAWVKTNPMPAISADRPAMGWEPILYLHRDDVKPAWNGGGRAGNYVMSTSQGSGHPTQKPLDMVRDFVQRFTNPGDLILDPFAGTGTTLRAAVDEGRRVVGVEQDERWCESIAERLSQTVLNFGDAS